MSAATNSFDVLPVQNPGPPYNAWGLNGPEDELGRLNLITPESIKNGKDEIKHGLVVNLNLPLATMPLNPARAGLEHNIIHRVHCNDDHLSFNTQCSTQWDGFRHYPYLDYPQKGQYTYYGGQSSDDARDKTVLRNGTQNYIKRPITSRAHLLDIKSYIEKHNLPNLAYFENTTPVPVSMLKACAREQHIQFQSGDILLVRIGWTEAFFGLPEEERQKLPGRTHRSSCGIEQGGETLRWHWENGIAAVVSDTVGYECLPARSSPSCHEVFLAGWGMPIGELFDLRQLAEECKRLHQYTFFFTSMVLNVDGGIASPPNAQAIL